MCCQMKFGEGEREEEDGVVEVPAVADIMEYKKVGSGRWG